MAYANIEARKKYMREYMREYYKNNEQYREYRNKWRQEHPESSRHHTWLRKARKRNYPIGEVNIIELIKEWDRVCGICKQSVEGSFDIDHIIPFCKGGIHEQSNLQLTHPECNRKKWKSIL